MNSPKDIQVRLLTPKAPGAVAIFQLSGPDIEAWVSQFTGKLPTEKAALVSFGQIDEGLQVKVAQETVQLMPHGGPRVMSQLLSHLTSHGASYLSDSDIELNQVRLLYPEAKHALEALTLFCISRAESRAALPLLWTEMSAWETRLKTEIKISEEDETAHPFDHLLKAPRIVLAGPPNAGKSTLSNLLSGQSTSITANEPGTTRDWVGHRVELSCDLGSFLVDWSDTPGIRQTDDKIEAEAIKIARSLNNSADLVIAIRSVDEAHSDFKDWPRQPDLLLVNKSDLYPSDERKSANSQEIYISSFDPNTSETLGNSIAEALGFFHSKARKPWLYHSLLKKSLTDLGLRQDLLQQ